MSPGFLERRPTLLHDGCLTPSCTTSIRVHERRRTCCRQAPDSSRCAPTTSLAAFLSACATVPMISIQRGRGPSRGQGEATKGTYRELLGELGEDRLRGAMLPRFQVGDRQLVQRRCAVVREAHQDWGVHSSIARCGSREVRKLHFDCGPMRYLPRLAAPLPKLSLTDDGLSSKAQGATTGVKTLGFRTYPQPGRSPVPQPTLGSPQLAQGRAAPCETYVSGCGSRPLSPGPRSGEGRRVDHLRALPTFLIKHEGERGEGGLPPGGRQAGLAQSRRRAGSSGWRLLIGLNGSRDRA